MGPMTSPKFLADSLPFPGRWIGGVCLILGPVLMLTGALLRIQFHFFAPQQLEAFAAHPQVASRGSGSAVPT